MYLQDWLEKARGHKYISRKPKKSGKGFDYTYADQTELPLTPRVAKPEAKKEAAPPPKSVTPTTPEAKEAPKQAEPEKPPAPTAKEVQAVKTEVKSKEENEKMFGLAGDVVRAAIPKADRGATLKAARALLDLAKQPGQKGKVLKEIRALSALARTQAKTMNNRYNADRNRDKPPSGRGKLYTYDDVLAARSVRDLLDKARAKVQGMKAKKTEAAPTKEVKAEIKAPPEAKPEAKKDEPAKIPYHKAPDFRGFSRQGFQFDVPGTTMNATVDQDPDVRSMSRYEALKMTVKNSKGEVQGTLTFGMDRDRGEMLTENARLEGENVPSAAKPVLLKLAAQGIAQRDARNEKEREARMRPKPQEQPQESGGESAKPEPKKEEPKTEPKKESPAKEALGALKGTIFKPGDLYQGSSVGSGWKVKKATSKAVTIISASGVDAGSKFSGKSYTYRWDGTGFKRQGEYLTEDGMVPVSKFEKSESMHIGDWLKKADDNKLGENQTEKDEDMKDEAKDKDAPKDTQDGEDTKDGDEMEKAPMCKACGKQHGGMEKCGMQKSMLDEWLQKSIPTHEARMGGPKSDTQGGSQDGGDWEGKGKTPDNNGGPVNAPGQDAQGKVTGADPGKQEKLSEDDEDQGEIGAPEKKKPIEKLGKSELYPMPLTPARQRDMLAHETAKLRKSPEMVTIGPENHPYGYGQTMGADTEELSKSEGSTDIPRLSRSPGQSLAQSHVLCKSVHASGCDSIHSAMLTACPDCGAGTTQHRIWPNSSEVQVIPVAGPGGLRPAKRDPMIKIQ